MRCSGSFLVLKVSSQVKCCACGISHLSVRKTDVWTHLGSSCERMNISHELGSECSDVWAPAATTFVARDLQGLVSQLNIETPQTELAVQELPQTQRVMSGQNVASHRKCGNGARESHRVKTEKTQSDERLKQKTQHLMIQAHQKFLEIDTVISTISSTQAASKLLRVRRRNRARTHGPPQWRNRE